MIVMKQHPLSAKFPSMPEEEYELLKADMKEHGQVEFITTHEGKVLDGWHRFRVCTELGLTPRLQKFTKKDAVAFVKSKNWHRRHMDASQRAFMIVSLNEWAASGTSKKTTGAILHPSATVAEMAEEAGTSERVIQQAKKVESDGSAALKEAVKDKVLPVHKAAVIAELPKPEQKAAIKEAKEPKPKKTKAAKPKKEEPDDGLQKELVAADKQILALQAQVESLKAEDKGAEIVKLHKRITGLEGRLASAITTKGVAEKTANYLSDLIAKIRKALKVDKNTDILQAIREG